jgi:hypothetical protein
MKPLITVCFLLVPFFTSFTFAQEKNGYKIEGSVKGLPNQSKIYLIHGGQRKTIDSAVVHNEHFVLSGNLQEPAHTYVYSGKTNKLADILLDNRAIVLSGSKPMYDSVKISGSPIDQQWKEWYREDQRIGYQRFRLNQVMKSLTDKKDTGNAAVITQLADELMQDRIHLLKTYVKRYHDSAAGAVLPTLCTIQNQLTKADYLEMYHTLTVAMQNTSFGKEILDQAQKSKK